MNNTDTNEIMEMRQQLAALKRRLENQDIVNGRLLKEAMSHKLSAINRRAILTSAICLVAIPYCFVVFRNLAGFSLAFCYGTTCMFLASIGAMAWSHYRLNHRDILSDNLVRTYSEVARLRKIYKRWHYVSIPVLLVWLAWFIYEIYANFTHDATQLWMMSTSCLVGALIGGTIGLRIHNKTIRNADEILRQIEELRRE